MFGALLHDIGKPSTTVLPLCTAHGHDAVGAELAVIFMNRLTNNKTLIEQVSQIVRLHMNPGQLHRAKAKDAAWWKRLHNKFRLDVLGWVSKADSCGRTGYSLADVHEVWEQCFSYFSAFGKIKLSR